MESEIHKMENEQLIAVEFDGITGEIIERPMTVEEIENHQEMLILSEKNKNDALKAEQKRQTSIRKMAEASGLTEAEIEALF